MNATIRHSRIWFAGLLGAAVLTGSPLAAQADDGKWWDPQQRGPVQERRQERRVERGSERPRQERHVERRAGRRDDDRPVVRNRVYRGERPRFQRQYVHIRDGYRGPRYRAHRVWVRPVFFHRQQLCVVRPVRYFVAAGLTIGGVRVNARYHDSDRYYYGCNFCDSRFVAYRSYRSHVVRCDDRPQGYRFEVSDWEDDWSLEARGDYHDGHGCDGYDGCDDHANHRYDDDVYEDDDR